MNCARCGYLMDDFDDGCPRCHGYGLPPRPEPPLPRVWPWKRWLARSLIVVLVVVAGYRTWFQLWIHAQRDSVLEAVVAYPLTSQRHLIKRKPIINPVFVEINGRDPSDTFLQRFRRYPFAVRKLSQANKIAAQDDFRKNDGFLHPVFRFDYIDKDTGEKGVPLFMGEPEWDGPFKARVGIPFSFGEGYFVVERRDGKWVALEPVQTVDF